VRTQLRCDRPDLSGRHCADNYLSVGIGLPRRKRLERFDVLIDDERTATPAVTAILCVRRYSFSGRSVTCTYRFVFR
jgi:hypothetical protein